MIPVVHTCGNQIGWHHGKPTDKRSSRLFTRMDGPHPEHHSVVKEYCSQCKRYVRGEELSLSYPRQQSDLRAVDLS